MYIEASTQKNGDKARLITPKYPFFQNGYCLSLYYHMFGKSSGKDRQKLEL